jgi:hypothetical protein
MSPSDVGIDSERSGHIGHQPSGKKKAVFFGQRRPFALYIENHLSVVNGLMQFTGNL